MTAQGNINWGLHRVPNERTVDRNLRNWDAVSRNPRTMLVMDKAKQIWGRDRLWDFPTKIGAIISRSGASDLAYVSEALLVDMIRQQRKDPWTVDALSGKGGEVDCILWRKNYIAQMMSDYPALLRRETPVQQDQASTARELLSSPWQLHDKLVGPTRDPTWINTLPSEAARMLFKHVLDLQGGMYKPEVVGALTQAPTAKFTAEKFHETDRAKRRFFTDVQIAYDSITKKTGAGDETAGGSAEGVAASAAAAEKKKDAAAIRSTRVQEFRNDAERYVSAEVEAALPSQGGARIGRMLGRAGAWSLGAAIKDEERRRRRPVP